MLAPRMLAWSLVAIVLAGVLAWSLRPAREAVEVTHPFRGPFEVTLAQEGRTHIVDRYVVSAPVAGHLRRIALKPGDEAAANSVLAEIAPLPSTALDPRTAAEARAALARAAAGERAAAAESDAATTDADRAAQRASRLHAAAAGGAVTRDELEAADSTARAAAARARAAVFAAEFARAEVAAARARLSVAAGTPGHAEVVRVRAPVAACVLKVLHESEGVVPAGEPLLELGCRATLEIRADVLSADALQLTVGGVARIEEWGGERPLAARIRRIEPQAFTHVSALGIEEQRVWVVLDLAGPAAAWARLGDDYRVMVQFVVARAAAALQVPASAVFEHDGRAMVFVVGRDDTLVARGVTTRGRNAGFVEVLDGLDAADRVVVHPRRDFTAGTRVTVQGEP